MLSPILQHKLNILVQYDNESFQSFEIHTHTHTHTHKEIHNSVLKSMHID